MTMSHNTNPQPQPTDEPGRPATAGRRPTGSVAVGLVALIFVGAIFGFFYAWVCSTMWGLDNTDPRVAIEAMNAMNESVRNIVFLPAFFGTPFVLAGAALYARIRGACRSSLWYLVASLVYGMGGMALTRAINVPMNHELADTVIPSDLDAAQQVWSDYSVPWQRWNLVRTMFSGVALVATGLAMFAEPLRPNRRGA